jgi:hypothetical protein
VSEVAVTDFATANATLSFSFAGREGREVVVEEEALATLVEHIVEDFLIEFCAEGYGRERLSFTTGENSRSVRTGDVVNLAPDGTNFGGFTTIEADAFVKDAAAHSLALYVVVVAFNERSFFLAFFFGD